MVKTQKPHPAMFLPGMTHTVQLSTLFELIQSRHIGTWMRSVEQDASDWNGGMTYFEACNAAVLGKWDAPKINALTLPELTSVSDDRRYFNDVSGEQLDIAAYCGGEPEYWQNSEPIEKPCGRIFKFAVEIGGLGDIDADHLRNRGEAIIALINSLELQGHSIEVTIVRAWTNHDHQEFRFLVPIKQAGQSVDVRRLQFIIGHPSFYRRCLFGLTELAQGKNMRTCGTTTDMYMPEGYIHIGHKSGLGSAEDATSLGFPVSLTERYRPLTMSEFVGLSKPKAICAKLAANPFPSAWLFLGPSGTGKTTMAAALAQMIPAEVHHIPSQNCDLATLERVSRTCQYVPMEGKRMHMILIDEADQMTAAAQLLLHSKLDGTAALPNTIWVFTCNAVDRLQDRFLSRVKQVEFSSYGIAAEAAALLERIWTENVPSSAAKPNFARIVKEANNNVREALMRLETEIMLAA